MTDAVPSTPRVLDRETVQDALADDGAWADLTTGADDALEQIRAILLDLRRIVNADLTNRAQEVKEAEADAREGVIAATRYYELRDEHREWEPRATRFRSLVRRRIGEIDALIKERNIALEQARRDQALQRSEIRRRTHEVTEARQAQAHREAVRLLAQAIIEHSRRTTEPTDLDRALWNVLDVVRVPYQGSDVTVRAMLDGGPWQYVPAGPGSAPSEQTAQ